MPTLNQKIVANRLIKKLRKGTKVSVSKEMAGVYSGWTSKHPDTLTNSKGFIKILEAAGLTDTFLAKTHNELLQSARIESKVFPCIRKETLVKISKSGRKLKKPKLEITLSFLSENDVTKKIESVPGHTVLSIHKQEDGMLVYFKAPENVVRRGAIELGYKAKNHMSPDIINIIDHELSPEEMKMYSLVLGQNKK